MEPVAKVTTPQGTLLGQHVGEGADAVRVFRGVPYAVPPVGVRRWTHAEPARGWEGERLAVASSPECPQPTLPPDDFYYRPAPQVSEDCLYLNVWAPVQRDGPLPVMVWIHGGSLIEGSGSSPAYDGTALARKGVVVVTINYRLGVFGFLAHPELTAESELGVSGNYGLTDQVLALRWVRDNIGAFGGDPDRVTIFGESSGALSVFCLLVSPLSEGLFHRAIAQSPYLNPMPRLRDETMGKPSAEATGAWFVGELGVGSMAELRDLQADRLVEGAIEAGFQTISAEPVLDDWVLTGQVYELLERGDVHDVPVVVGFNSGEADHFALTPGWAPSVPGSADEYLALVKQRYGDLTDDYVALYPPDDLEAATLHPIRDGLNGWAAEKLARASARTRSNAYLYYFDHAPVWAASWGVGAFHAAEIAHVFDNVRHGRDSLPRWPREPARDIDLSMSDVMSDYWTAFARTGEPSSPGGPTWTPFNVHERHYMAFRDGRALPEQDLHPGVWELHEQVLAERRATGRPWVIDLGLAAPPLAGQSA